MTDSAPIDRDVQRQILEGLLQRFPAVVPVEQLGLGYQSDSPQWVANIAYLAGHGLVEAKTFQPAAGHPAVGSARLASRGVDFLLDDGGLSAVLGVVTVRLHDDTIKSLIADRIQQTDLPPPDKQRFLARLRSLPADATRHLVLKLMEKGLDHAPDAVRLLETFLRNP